MPFNFTAQTAHLLRLVLLLIYVLASTQFVSGQVVPDSGVAPVVDSLPVPDIPRDTPAVTVVKPVIVPVTDTAPATIQQINPDSVSKRPWYYREWQVEANTSFFIQVLNRHPYFGFGSRPVVVHTQLKQFQGKEIIFYVLIALLLAFAFLREAFPKYFNDLFRVLFRTTLKQKQVREQLMQTPLPSLLLNIFYMISAGLYINIVLHHFDRTPVDNFWFLFLYCALGLLVIYMVKFIGLKISGWIFNIKEGAETYIFIVFLINKVIGIFLLPFLVLLTFIQGNAYPVILVLSWCGIGVLFIYRFLLTYSSIRNQVRFNPFHFFLYLCAFELAPLLLIYKALLFFFQ